MAAADRSRVPIGLAHHGTVLREIRSNAFENAHRAGFFSSLPAACGKTPRRTETGQAPG